MKRICVFCGSSPGSDGAYLGMLQDLASHLVKKKMSLVYGGAKVGLMGALADAMMARGGEVTGVIVSSLVKKEIAHDSLSKLYVVDSMHQRKAKMYELSDAFIALPGGLGTLEEFFEVVTWAQLGFHEKPAGLLNVKNFFAPLLEFLDHATSQGFIRPEHRSRIYTADNIAELLSKFENHTPATSQKWIRDKDNL